MRRERAGRASARSFRRFESRRRRPPTSWRSWIACAAESIRSRLRSAEQERGNQVVFRASVAMREVAQQVRRTTDEQARGFSSIRENVEGVRQAVEEINSSLREQSNACAQVAGFSKQVFERTRSNEEAAQRMGDSMMDLVRQAEGLRENVARFQT